MPQPESTPEFDPSRRLYDRLEVNTGASQTVIQAAYRALVRNWHPDVNATPEAAERIRELNEAYDVLSNPLRRAEYDLERVRWRRREQSLRGAEHPPISRTAGAASEKRRALTLGDRGGSGGHTPQRLPVYSPHLVQLMVVALLVIAALILLISLGLSAATDDAPTLTSAPRVVQYSR